MAWVQVICQHILILPLEEFVTYLRYSLSPIPIPNKELSIIDSTAVIISMETTSGYGTLAWLLAH